MGYLGLYNKPKAEVHLGRKLTGPNEEEHFFFENHAVYEIMWKNVVERVRPQMRI
jgi:hypothetical protein